MAVVEISLQRTIDAGGMRTAPAFLRGGGEMGALMRAHDWTASSLGRPEQWPQSLRTVVRLMLNTGHPMYIWWGADGACLYNDAYRESIGPERHPGSLGRPAREVWHEIWDVIGPQIEQVMSGRGATWHEDHLVPITRHGRREDVYWTYSYSPIDDETAPAGVGGVLVVCTETTKKVLAERRLANEITRQRRLFQCAPGFIAILAGPDHVFEFVNDGYVQLLGDREFIGKSVRDAIPEIGGQGYIELLDHVFATGERHVAGENSICLARTPGGVPEHRFLDFIYEPIVDDSGNVTGIFVEGFEVSDRASATAALRDSEARLRELNAHLEREVLERSAVGGQFWQISPDLLGVLNPDGCFERVNPAWTAVLGWTEAEIRAMPIFELLHPADRERTRAGFEHLKAGNPILRFENRYRRKDGGYNWFAWAAAPLGEAYYCSGRDITAEKVQAEILAARTAELNRVWDQSRDLQVVIGLDGVFRAANPAWTEILGYEPAEIIGRSFLDLILPEDASHTRSGLDRAATADLTSFENRYRHKDGTVRWISWNTSVEGDLVYAYGRDITAQRAAQRELAVAQEALRQAQKMEALGQLTGGVAHDFNNLLTIIRGSSDLLREPQIGEERHRRYLDQITESVIRATKLTNQLLAFARQQALKPEIFEVGERINAIAEMLRTVVGARIAIDVALSEHPYLVSADLSQFETALVNMAANARDAMDGEGTLTIRVWRQSPTPGTSSAGEFVAVSVGDTGSGIQPDRLGKIFEPFYTTKEIGKGTGLGLSQVYGFCKQSGGDVAVESAVDVGTTFTVYLPLVADQTVMSGASGADATVALVKKGEGRRILVVEDNAEVGSFSTQLLEDLGYHATLARNAKEALSLLAAGLRVELVFTDVVMPGMSGLDLGQEIRRQYPDLPVVLTSGYSHVLAEKGRYGFELLQKPYAADELSRLLHRLAG
jgi:PAS domain S-box-containing protein